MTTVMAIHAFGGPLTITMTIGALVGGSSAVRRLPWRPRADRRAEPSRITVEQLRADRLRSWPEAPGVYFPRDRSLHCRRCVDDPSTLERIVEQRDDHDRMLVLFGAWSEEVLVAHNCSTHGSPPPAA